jgi:hypothetical protein
VGDPNCFAETLVDLPGRRAEVRVLVEAVEDERLDLPAQARAKDARRGRRSVYVLAGDRYGGAGERCLVDRRLIEGYSQRVNVTLWGDLLSSQLLR